MNGMESQGPSFIHHNCRVKGTSTICFDRIIHRTRPIQLFRAHHLQQCSSPCCSFIRDLCTLAARGERQITIKCKYYVSSWREAFPMQAQYTSRGNIATTL